MLSEYLWEPFPNESFATHLEPFDLIHRFKPFLWENEYVTSPKRYFKLYPSFGPYISYDDKENYEFNLDVQHFSPKEISVRISGRSLIIEGKHKKEDKHGDISREFTRKYIIPDGYDVKKVKCTLSKDGILNVTVAKMNVPKDEIKVKVEQVDEERKEKLKSKL